ncbi:MAG: hypothetical protein ACKVJK_01895 [Methylophagaceae bacterium]|jgi:hypothetical protein|tara:strand:- start:213 stop:539 length:327 start_codon:yes stop_codon:yes gene_type:complete
MGLRKQMFNFYKYIKEEPKVNNEIVKALMEDCKRGTLDVDNVLEAALNKLAELDNNAVLTMAVEHGFIIAEDYADDTRVRIEREIDADEHLTAQQKIIEKVLARYGDQ